MRIKLLIASAEGDYAEHLSNRISDCHGDAFDVSVCSSREHMPELLSSKKFDAALLEASFAGGADLSCIDMPLILWEEDADLSDAQAQLKKIRKYQRVSSMVADVLEKYAKAAAGGRGSEPEKAQITAVWSPAGGVGKTSVALAYAAKKASEGKQALYLNLEAFSSVPAYFGDTGKGISAVFEMLENHEGNVSMLIRGIKRQDSETGVAYFCRPDNFDDMNILSTENVSELIDACAGVIEELVVDMSCVCDERTRQVFKCADRVLLVTDATNTAQIKLSQFAGQHNVFERIKDKAVLVANKGAAVHDSPADAIIALPLVQSPDAAAVSSALSGCSFEMGNRP